ncbi:hypothetical protein QR680_016282 [Steinernema hermaphroditum]|uniref:G-protein coupled receptors family 1 profile domain-containing protein n=1 Tax=Steinernema hermaphroditum TaxID=289476 RepID=A0AA39HAZ2_9BILA|nr:hypothetical protein QR680_016282 [Steinernema hermaphroditum]
MSGDFLNVLFSYFLAAFGFSIGLLFLYIVITKSPPCLRVYRNTILNLTFFYLFAMFVHAFMTQQIQTMYGSKSCAKFVAPLAYLGREMTVLSIYMYGLAVQNVAIAIAICFFYRYEQIRHMNVSDHGKSSFRVALCVSAHGVGSIAMGALAHVVALNAEITENNGIYVVCFDESNYSSMTVVSAFALLLVTTVATAIVILATMTIRILRKQKVLMSKQTYRLQKLLTINLLVLLALPFFFDLIPIVLMALDIVFGSNNVYLFTSLATHLPYFDVILSFVVTLGFVTPYREAVISKLWSGQVVTPAVSIVTSHTP